MAVARADGGSIYLRDATPRRLSAGRLAQRRRRRSRRRAWPWTTAPGRALTSCTSWRRSDSSSRCRSRRMTAGFTHGARGRCSPSKSGASASSGCCSVGSRRSAASTMHTLEAIAALRSGRARERARCASRPSCARRSARTLNDCAERLLDPDADVPGAHPRGGVQDRARRRRALVDDVRARRRASTRASSHAVGDDSAARRHGAADDGALPARVAGAARAQRRRGRGDARRDTVIGQIARQAGDARRSSSSPCGSAIVRSASCSSSRPSRASTPKPKSRPSSSCRRWRRRRWRARDAQAEERAAARAHRRDPRAPADRRRRHDHPAARSCTATRRRATSPQRMGSEKLDWRDQHRRGSSCPDRDGRPLPPEREPLARAFAGDSHRARAHARVAGRASRCTCWRWPCRSSTPTARVEAVQSPFQDVTELRELADAKDRFLSIASHELRSPITSLRATTSLLQLDPNALTDESRRTVLLVAHPAADRSPVDARRAAARHHAAQRRRAAARLRRQRSGRAVPGRGRARAADR